MDFLRDVADRWDAAGKELAAIENYGMREIRAGPEGLRDALHNNALRSITAESLPGSDIANGLILLMVSKSE
jgi:hypothetical protein